MHKTTTYFAVYCLTRAAAAASLLLEGIKTYTHVALREQRTHKIYIFNIRFKFLVCALRFKDRAFIDT